jgi:hypothetical protein
MLHQIKFFAICPFFGHVYRQTFQNIFQLRGIQVSTPPSHLGGIALETKLGGTNAFVVLLSSSRQTLGQYFKTGHNHFHILSGTTLNNFPVQHYTENNENLANRMSMDNRL